jgi:hypothetical protein
MDTFEYWNIPSLTLSPCLYLVPALQQDSTSCAYFTCYNIFAYVNVFPQLYEFYGKVSKFVQYRNSFVDGMKNLFALVFNDGKMPTLMKLDDMLSLLGIRN